MQILFLMGAGIYFFINGLLELKKRRVLQNTPTSKIRSLAMGPAEVKGSAHAKTYLISPLSKSKCVYYYVQIQEYKQRGKSGSYVTIKTLRDGRYFFLKDETGEIMVDAGSVIIDVPTKFTKYIKNKIDDKVRLLLDEQKINYKNFLGLNKSMRVIETFVAPGQQLYVFGTVENNPLVEDGTTVKNEDDLIIKRKKGNYFIISAKEEKEILKTMAWLAPLKIIGGGVTFILCLMGILGVF